MRRPSLLLLLVLATLAGCSSFPKPTPDATFADGLSAQAIFDRSLAVHGGDMRADPGDINLSTDGHWHALIQKIQPLVTDAPFRTTSQERYRPRDGVYAVHHAGPAGTKQVVRTPSGVTVAYNGVPSNDADLLSATRMTNDAFAMFHFGPSFLLGRTTAITRLPDAHEAGQRYYRLLATLSPGFGDAAHDDVVLWIDARSSRLWRIHMTLNGFRTTQGAHVDTTFLDYRQVGPYLLPVRFIERVRGPLRTTAHEWQVTGIDLDRGWSTADVSGAAFTGAAAAPATLLPQPLE